MVSISIDIDEQVKEHFNKFIDKHGTNIDLADVAEAKVKISEIRESNQDGYIIEQTGSLESMIAMISDDIWKIKDSSLEKINATIKYFVDDDDIIPDHIPGIGYLDDCIIIDGTMDDIHEEIAEFKDFCRTRMIYSQEKDFTFEDWQNVKNQEATSRVRNRRLRRSRRY